MFDVTRSASALALRLTSLVALASLALMGSACGAGGGVASIPVGSTSTISAIPVYRLKAANVDGLGKILVDGQGFTLYVYEPDHQSGTSTCVGTCEVGWPPLVLPSGVKGAVAGPGVQQSLLGTTDRGNGVEQVTYDRWPLYRWEGDSAPGQASGEGLFNSGGLWYVIGPGGNVIGPGGNVPS